MGWTVYNSDGKVLQSAEVSDNAVTSAKIADGAIMNADVNDNAALAYSKLAALADGNILIGNGSNVATSVNPTGDIDISNSGVFELNATAISGFAAKTSIADADTILLGDSAASGALKKMTKANFVAGVGGTTALSAAIEEDILPISGTTARTLFYQLGPMPYDAPSSGNNVGFGNCFSFNANGSGSAASHSTQERGAWALTAGAADQRRVSLYTYGNLAWEDDWTIVARFYYVSGTLPCMGLTQANPNIYRPFNTQRGAHVEINNGANATLRTRGASGNTDASLGSVSNNAIHTFKLRISGNGTSVAATLDNTTTQTITTNMNSSITSHHVYFNNSAYDSNARTTHLLDFYAYREL